MVIKFQVPKLAPFTRQLSASSDDVRSHGFTIPSSCRPPPASISKNLGRMIFCQVCGHLIEFAMNYQKLVVLCTNCREATPTRPAPADRRFYRCTCGRLILVRAEVDSVNCPRPGCRQLLLLPSSKALDYSEHLRPHSAQASPLAESRTSSVIGVHTPKNYSLKEVARPIELRCGSCYYRFYAPNAFGLTSDARCPHCKKRTSVGPEFARGRGHRLVIYALFALFVSLTISVTSYVFRERNGGLFSLDVGFMLAGLIMLIKAIGYYLMPVSRIVIGGYEI